MIEIGYGDVSVNKKMKEYVNLFYSILEKIEFWKNKPMAPTEEGRHKITEKELSMPDRISQLFYYETWHYSEMVEDNTKMVNMQLSGSVWDEEHTLSEYDFINSIPGKINGCILFPGEYFHKIKFPKYRYGGLGFRGHGEWNGKQNSFFLTSNGESNRIKGHATRARWCHISGKTGGKLGGIGILCHPSNFRFPQPMRVHPTEPFFNFAPSQTGDWEIKPNDDYVSRYRFVETDGKPDTSLLDRLWNDYAQPPRVEIYTLD